MACNDDPNNIRSESESETDLVPNYGRRPRLWIRPTFKCLIPSQIESDSSESDAAESDASESDGSESDGSEIELEDVIPVDMDISTAGLKTGDVFHIIKVCGDDFVTVEFRMYDYTQITRLMTKYCDEMKIDKLRVSFNYKGTPIEWNKQDTPLSLEMEHRDSIQISMQRRGRGRKNCCKKLKTSQTPLNK